MRIIRTFAIVVLISVFSGVLFSSAFLATNAQLAATDVNVINIKSINKTVWFRETIPESGYLEPPFMCSSWGRGKMYLLIEAYGLEGAETMTFIIWAPIWKEDKTASLPLIADMFDLTATDNEQTFVTDVPSAQFYFSVIGPAGSQASLSYYLSV